MGSRREYFFGTDVRRIKFATHGFRLAIKQAIRQQIEIMVDTASWAIDVFPWDGQDRRVRIQGIYDYMVENVLISAEELKIAYTDWKADMHESADQQADNLKENFREYFGYFWEELDSLVRRAVQYYADADKATEARTGPKLDRSVAAAGKLTSIQTSISQLERVQSLVNRDLVKLRRQAEARLS